MRHRRHTPSGRRPKEGTTVEAFNPYRAAPFSTDGVAALCGLHVAFSTPGGVVYLTREEVSKLAALAAEEDTV